MGLETERRANQTFQEYTVMSVLTLDALQFAADEIEIKFGLTDLDRIISNYPTRRIIIGLLASTPRPYLGDIALKATRGLPILWLVYRYNDFEKLRFFGVDPVARTVEEITMEAFQ
jgi:hypothetical protein